MFVESLEAGKEEVGDESEGEHLGKKSVTCHVSLIGWQML